MNPVDDTAENTAENTADDSVDSTAEHDESRGRSLWDVMGRNDQTTDNTADSNQPPGPTDRPVLPDDAPVELDEATRDEDPDEPERESEPKDPDRVLSRSCRISLVTGSIAIPLAGLGLVPPVFWTSLPALAVGLVAVYTGLVGISETRSASRRRRGALEAVIGISLGTLGMFLPRMLQLLI
jgi:hypothetical protein